MSEIETDPLDVLQIRLVWMKDWGEVMRGWMTKINEADLSLLYNPDQNYPWEDNTSLSLKIGLLVSEASIFTGV